MLNLFLFVLALSDNSYSICFFKIHQCPEHVEQRYRFTETNISNFKKEIFPNPPKSFNFFIVDNMSTVTESNPMQLKPILINFRQFFLLKTEFHFYGTNSEEIWLDSSMNLPFLFSFENLRISIFSTKNLKIICDSIFLKNCQFSNSTNIVSHFFSSDFNSICRVNTISAKSIIFSFEKINKINEMVNLTINNSIQSTVLFTGAFSDNHDNQTIVSFVRETITIGDFLSVFFLNSLVYINFEHLSGNSELAFVSPFNSPSAIQENGFKNDKKGDCCFCSLSIYAGNSSIVRFMDNSFWGMKIYLNNNNGGNATLITECQDLPCHLLSSGFPLNLIVKCEKCFFSEPFELKGNELNILNGNPDSNAILIFEEIRANFDISVSANNEKLTVEIGNLSTMCKSNKVFKFKGKANFFFKSFGNPFIEKHVSNLKLINESENKEDCKRVIKVPLEETKIGKLTADLFVDFLTLKDRKNENKDNLKIISEINKINKKLSKRDLLAKTLNNQKIILEFINSLKNINKTEIQNKYGQKFDVLCLKGKGQMSKYCNNFDFSFEENGFSGFTAGTEIFTKSCSENCIQLEISKKISEVSNEFCFATGRNSSAAFCPPTSTLLSNEAELQNWKSYIINPKTIKKLSFSVYNEIPSNFEFDFEEFENAKVTVYSPFKKFEASFTQKSFSATSSMIIDNLLVHVIPKNEPFFVKKENLIQNSQFVKDLSLFRTTVSSEDLNMLQFNELSVLRAPVSVFQNLRNRNNLSQIDVYDLSFKKCQFNNNSIEFSTNETEKSFIFINFSTINIHLDSSYDNYHLFSSEVDNYDSKPPQLNVDFFSNRKEKLIFNISGNEESKNMINAIKIDFNRYDGDLFSYHQKVPLSLHDSKSRITLASSKKVIHFTESLHNVQSILIANNISEVIFNDIYFEDFSTGNKFVNYNNNSIEATDYIIEKDVSIYYRNITFLGRNVFNDDVKLIGTINIFPSSVVSLNNIEICSQTSLSNNNSFFNPEESKIVVHFKHNQIPFIYINDISNLNCQKNKHLRNEENRPIEFEIIQDDKSEITKRVKSIKLVSFSPSFNCENIKISRINLNTKNEVVCRDRSIVLFNKDDGGDDGKKDRMKVILLATLIPAFSVIIIAILVVVIMNRSKKNKENNGIENNSSIISNANSSYFNQIYDSLVTK